MSERPYRLTGVGAFEAVFRAGRRHEGRYVQLIVAAATQVPGRAGFVIGRKAVRRAIDRNRLKRRVREALRGARGAIATLDLVVRVKRPLKRTEIDAAADEARTLLAACSGPSQPL